MQEDIDLLAHEDVSDDESAEIQSVMPRQTNVELLQEIVTCLSGTIPLRAVKTLGPIFVWMFMAHLGEDVRAATTIINVVESTESIIFNSPMFYLPTVVGEKIDAGTPEEVGREAQIGWMLAIISSIPQYLIMLNIRPILQAMQQEPAVIDISEEFFSVYILAATILSMQVTSDQLSQGSKNIYPPVVAQFVSWVACVFFAYGLSWGEIGMPELGVRGAAWALVGRAYLNFFLYSSYLASSSQTITGRFGSYQLFNKFDHYKQSLYRQLKNGALMLVGSISIVGSTFFVNIVAGTMGNVALTSQLVISMYSQIIMIGSAGIGAASQIVISNNKEQHAENVFRYGNVAALLATILPACYFLFSVAAPKMLIWPIFDPTDDGNRDAVDVLINQRLLLISDATSLFNSLQMVIAQSLMGKDRVMVPLSFGIICNWIGAVISLFATDIVSLNLAVCLGQLLACVVTVGYWLYDHYSEFPVKTVASSHHQSRVFTYFIDCYSQLFNRHQTDQDNELSLAETIPLRSAELAK